VLLRSVSHYKENKMALCLTLKEGSQVSIGESIQVVLLKSRQRRAELIVKQSDRGMSYSCLLAEDRTVAITTDVTVAIVRARQGRCSIAVIAPKDVKISREGMVKQ